VDRTESTKGQDDDVAWCVAILRQRAEIPELLDTVITALLVEGVSRKDVFDWRLALEEALCNAIEHGNNGDPSKRVWLRYRTRGEWLLAEVEDEGVGFDPAGVSNPLLPENLKRPCGRGVLLMRHSTTWLRFNDRGNCVSMGKRRSRGASESST
jgi:serine/threonine-protein kinase RsbW